MTMVFQTTAVKVQQLPASEQKRLYKLLESIKYNNPDVILSLLYRYSQQQPELSDQQLKRAVQHRLEELLEDDADE